MTKFWKPTYEPWRHGGWYVTNCDYVSGAAGCVSRNYPDRKWRVACHVEMGTFATRAEAAYAEQVMVLQDRLRTIARRCHEAVAALDGTEAAGKFSEIRDFALKGAGGTQDEMKEVDDVPQPEVP